MAAFQQYNTANLALMQSSVPIMTIEATLAQRRLEEDYCAKSAMCRTAGVPEGSRATPLAAAFSECLSEIAKERADLSK
jgi:hypothetical protein